MLLLRDESAHELPANMPEAVPLDVRLADRYSVEGGVLPRRIMGKPVTDIPGPVIMAVCLYIMDILVT